MVRFFFQEPDNQGGPSCLMGCAKALSGLGVEVFVEKQVFIPMGVITMPEIFSKNGALPVPGLLEEGGEAAGDFPGDSGEIHHLA
jgi:hypothetical protein